MSAARRYDTEGGISRFSLDRRITVLVLFMSLLVVGIIATSRIPVELIPRGYDEPFLSVRVPWEDAPSREVMDKLSLPLEEELSTVKGVENLTTISLTGRSVAWIQFKQGTDMDVAYREVRDRIERARTQFPEDVDEIYINKDDASGIPVYVLGIAVDESVADPYDLIENQIKLPILRIDGVASVETDGLIEKEILIELDREKTNSAGLNIYDLAQELSGDNFTLASGTVRDGSRKLLLRSVAKYSALEEIEDRMVGGRVRLKDIATVSYAVPEANFRVRAMSKPAVAMVVLKEGEANVREVSQAVHAEVERLKAQPHLQHLETVTLFSQGETIDEALRTLLGSGMIGGLIAVCVLFLFLRRIRLTLIIALGIPLSLLIGLTAMYFGGESLNLLTLLGLMLCVGLLVDNSVVVAENIHRLHRDGMPRREAAIRGAGEVSLAILMSTLTTIVVFLPVALADGPAQFFLLRLAIPVCVSVAASLLVALVFIPLCVYLTLPSNGVARKAGALRKMHDRVNNTLRWIYDSTFDRLNRGYNVFLTFFLRRRLDLVLGVAAVFAITAAGPMQQVKFVDVQEEEGGGFYIGVEMPNGTTLEETEEWFLKAEKVVEERRDELGLDGWFVFHRTTFGEIQGWFKRPKTVDLNPSEVTEIVKKALPAKPGMKLSVGRNQDSDEVKGNNNWSITLSGDDPDQVLDVAEQLENVLVQVPGVVGKKSSDRQAPNELGLVIDRQRARQYDVNPEVVAGVVGYALRGTPLPKYRAADGREIPVRVRFQESDRESLTELAAFNVPTNNGGFLPVSALTEATYLDSPRWIVRRNKQTGAVITLELAKGEEEETRKRLSAITQAVDFPEGISIGANVQQQSLNEDMQALQFALVLSVIFIYLLMGFLFESFILPLSIVLTIPLSIIGVYWIHMFTGYDIDFLGVVAAVLLVGVVVNNGIVLIDYVNRLRAQGRSRQDALLTATHRRFRPIMMTAITTIGGMIPLAFAGANSIGLSYTSFSLTLIGGMTTATLLTLLVVPVFYTFFDDMRETVGAALRRALGRRQSAGATAVAAVEAEPAT